MATPAPALDDLLLPISEENPGGEDISIAPEWADILEARRDGKDQQGLSGAPDDKEPNWHQVQDQARAILATKSKDLLTAVWFTEASLRLDGFQGFRTGLDLLRGLLERFWDTGLYPLIEDDDREYRARPLMWLDSEKASGAMRGIKPAAQGPRRKEEMRSDSDDPHS